MNLHHYLAYLIVSILTITSPGAAILLAITNAMRYNLKAVFFSTLGNIFGLFLLSVVAMFGVGALIKSSPVFFIILKSFGALYLIYLGITQLRNHHLKMRIQTQDKKTYKIEYFKIMKNGFFVAATNPKPILFFTAIFPLFMSEEYSIIGQFFIMTFTFMFISFLSLMTYGYISKKMHAWFLDEKSLKVSSFTTLSHKVI